MGFMPLSGRNDPSDSMGEGDIPLRPVQTAGSTGARRQNQTLDDMDLEQTSSAEEKKTGLFHRKSKNDAQGPAGRRKNVKALAEGGRKGTYGDEGGLNAMGRIYNKIIGFSVITRYLVYIAPVALVLAVPLIVIPITGHYEDTRVGGSRESNAPRLFDLFLWIEISWLALWGGKIVAHFLPPIFMFFCGVVSSGTRKYATVLKNLEIPVSLLLWALCSWLVFRFKFQINNGDDLQWVYVMARILGSLFVSSCVLLGEKAIIQLISITYHQRSFANRIKDSKREVFLLGLMYDASRTLFPMWCPEFSEEDYIINDSIEMMISGGKKRRARGHKKSGSVTPMHFIGGAAGGIGRVGDKITSVFGNLASEITGKQVFNPNSAHSIVVEALEKVPTSEALARRIWMSFVVEGNDSLYAEDIIEVLGPGHKEDAEECFEAVDADMNGDISLDEMVRKVVEIGKERKAISNSMKDIGQALRVLDSVLLFIVILIVVFVFLSFFNSSFVTTLASAGTALLSLSFAFSVTCQEFLGSCIFLFIKHPYDVGDRIDVSSEQMVVEKISLLYTVLTRIDKMQVVQVPNIVLNNLWIENVTRSKAMKEVIDVNISFDTSFEDVELLRTEMEKFVRHADNSRDFQPDLAIGVGSVGDLDKLTLKLAIKHKSNWHNDAVRATRRSKFICALALALKKVPIYGPGGGAEPLGGPTNPAYSVAVDDDFAAKARTKAEEAADALRIMPLKPKRGASTKVQHMSEKQAVAELNTRPPLEGLDSNYASNRDAVDERTESATLNSRDVSAERNRSDNLEQLRQDLVKRENTRGRRKAGEGVPSAPLSSMSPGLTVTQYDNDGNVIVGGNRQMSYDVVPGQGGMGSPYGGIGVASSPGYGAVPSVSPGIAAAAAQSYSLYPTNTYSPPGPGQDPSEQMTLPGQAMTTQAGPSIPEGRVLASPQAHGARQRGASVSQALEEREREEQARRQQGQGGQGRQYTK